MANARDDHPIEHGDHWLYSTLWIGCALGSIRGKLSVLDTILFTHGIPTRWLHTLDNGFLIARKFTDQTKLPIKEGLKLESLSSVPPLRTDTTSSTPSTNNNNNNSNGSNTTTQGSSTPANQATVIQELTSYTETITQHQIMQRLSEILQAFIKFIGVFNGGIPPSSNAPIALVVYKDGRREAMGVSDFSVMAPHAQWLASIDYLQPFLPPHELRLGVYERRTVRVGARIVGGTDFLGGNRASMLRELAKNRGSNFSNTSSNEGAPRHPVTKEDMYTLNMVRLFHSVFTVSANSSLAPPPFTGNVMSNTHITGTGRGKARAAVYKNTSAITSSSSSNETNNNNNATLTGSSDRTFLPQTGGTIIAKTAGKEEPLPDAVSSDSDTGHSAMIMIPPARTLRVIGLAIQFSIDSNNRPWLAAPLLLAFQLLVPVTSTSFTAEGRKNRAAASGPPGSIAASIANTGNLPKSSALGIPDTIAKEIAYRESKIAAYTALKDLRTLVMEGIERGLTFKTAWQHFDASLSGIGRIDDDTFRERLALLGITLHDVAWSELTKRIPKGSDQKIGPEEFQILLSRMDQDSDANRGTTNDYSSSSPGKRSTSSRARRINNNRPASGSYDSISDSNDNIGNTYLSEHSLTEESGNEGNSTAIASRSRSRTHGEGSVSASNNNNGNDVYQPTDAYGEARAAYAALQERLKSMSTSSADRRKKGISSTPSVHPSPDVGTTRLLNSPSQGDLPSFSIHSPSVLMSSSSSSTSKFSPPPRSTTRYQSSVDIDLVDSSGNKLLLSTNGMNPSASSYMKGPSLTEIIPDGQEYNIKPSGKGIDVAPRQAPLLAPDANTKAIRTLMDLVLSGKAVKAGLIDDQLQSTIIQKDQQSHLPGGGGIAGLEAAAELIQGTNNTAHATQIGMNAHLQSVPPSQMPGMKIGGKVLTTNTGGGANMGVYAGSVKPRGFEEAWKKERERVAVRKQAELSQELERAKKKEKERVRRIALENAYSDATKDTNGNSTGLPTNNTRRRRLRRAMEHFGSSNGGGGSGTNGNDSSYFLENDGNNNNTNHYGEYYDSDGNNVQQIADIGAEEHNLLMYQEENDTEPAGLRHKSKGAKALSAMLVDEYLSDHDGGSSGFRQNAAYYNPLLGQPPHFPVPSVSQPSRTNSNGGGYDTDAYGFRGGYDDMDSDNNNNYNNNRNPYASVLSQEYLDGDDNHAPVGVPVGPSRSNGALLKNNKGNDPTIGGLHTDDKYLAFLINQAKVGVKGGAGLPPLMRAEDLVRLITPTVGTVSQGPNGQLYGPDAKLSSAPSPVRTKPSLSLTDNPYQNNQSSFDMGMENSTNNLSSLSSIMHDHDEGPKGTPEEEEKRQRARYMAGNTAKASLAYGTPQEWVYDEYTTILYQILFGPQSFQSTVGTVHLTDAKAAGLLVPTHGEESDNNHSDPMSRPSTRASTASSRYPYPTHVPVWLRTPYASGRPVDILYIPDIYEDIDGLSTILRPTLSNCPGARLLIFQYPGLPGTKYNETTNSGIRPPRWSPDFAALILLKFLRWCRSNEVWGPTDVQHPHGDVYVESQGRPYRDVVIVGSGVGGHIASIFLTQFITFQPEFTGHRFSVLGGPGSRDFHLMSAIRSVVLINAYGYTDKGIKTTFDRIGQIHGQLAEISAVLAPHQQARAEAQARLTAIASGAHGKDKSPKKENSTTAATTVSAEVPIVLVPGTSQDSRRRKPDRPGTRGSLFQALRIDPFKIGAKVGPADIIRNEANQAIATILFGESYIASFGSMAPLMALWQANAQIADGEPTIDKGIVAIANGVGRGSDVRGELRDMPIPVLIIAGTEDAWVTPMHSRDIALARIRVGSNNLEKHVNGPRSGGESLHAFLLVAGYPPQPDQLNEYVGDGGTDAAALDDVTVVSYLKATGTYEHAVMEKERALKALEKSKRNDDDDDTDDDEESGADDNDDNGNEDNDDDGENGNDNDSDDDDDGNETNNDGSVKKKKRRSKKKKWGRHDSPIDMNKDPHRFVLVKDKTGKIRIRPKSGQEKPRPQLHPSIRDARPGTQEANVRDNSEAIALRRITNNRPTHVVWLRAGHNVLQERKRAVLKVLTAVFQGKADPPVTTNISSSDNTSMVPSTPGIHNTEGGHQFPDYRGNTTNLGFSSVLNSTFPGADQVHPSVYARNMNSNTNATNNNNNANEWVPVGETAHSFHTAPVMYGVSSRDIRMLTEGNMDDDPTRADMPPTPSNTDGLANLLPPHTYAPGQVLVFPRTLPSSPAPPTSSSSYGDSPFDLNRLGSIQTNHSMTVPYNQLSPGAHQYTVSASAAASPILPSSTSLFSQMEEMAQERTRNEARSKVAEELARRGLSTHGTEFELLTRLEEALENEGAVALEIEERTSDSKAMRLRRQLKFEQEMEEKRKREIAAARKKRKAAKAALNRPKGERAEAPEIDLEVLANDRKLMTEEDALATRIEAFHRAQIQREKDAQILSAAIASLRYDLQKDEMVVLQEALLAACGKDNVEVLMKKGILTPSLLSYAADQLSIGDSHAAGKIVATGLAYLTLAAGLTKATHLDDQAKHLAIVEAEEAARIDAQLDQFFEQQQKRNAGGITTGQEEKKDEMENSSLRPLTEEEERQKIEAEEKKKDEEELLNMRRAFLEAHIDLRRTRAAKLAVLRTAAMIASLRTIGAEAGYGLHSDNPRILQEGSKRLISTVHDLRVRRGTALRRWRRALHKIRLMEATIMKETANLRNFINAQRLAKREMGRIRTALEKAQIEVRLINESTAMKTVTAEISEIGYRIADQEAVVKGFKDQFELLLVDFSGQSAAVRYLLRISEAKETTLVDMRNLLSRLITKRKEDRRLAKVAQEQSTMDVGLALSSIATQQARLTELKNERLRLKGVSTRYTDTTVWNDGVAQRIQTKELRTWLNDQVLRYKVLVAEGIVAVERQRSTTDAAETAYATAHEDVLLLTRTLEAVVAAIRLSASQGVKRTPEEILKAEADDVDTLDRLGVTAAEAAAGKKRKDQSKASNRVTDWNDDHLDEENAEDNELDGTVAGSTDNGTTRRQTNSHTGPAERRESNIAWRANQLAKAAEREAYCAEILNSREVDVLGTVGALVERIPDTSVQLGWITDWMDHVHDPLPEEVQSVLRERRKAAQKAREASNRTLDGKTNEPVTQPLTKEKEKEDIDTNIFNWDDDGEDDIPDNSNNNLVRLGYASFDSLVNGMSVVVGTPAHPFQAIVPLDQLPWETKPSSANIPKKPSSAGLSSSSFSSSSSSSSHFPPPPPPSSFPPSRNTVDTDNSDNGNDTATKPVTQQRPNMNRFVLARQTSGITDMYRRGSAVFFEANQRKNQESKENRSETNNEQKISESHGTEEEKENDDNFYPSKPERKEGSDDEDTNRSRDTTTIGSSLPPIHPPPPMMTNRKLPPFLSRTNMNQASSGSSGSLESKAGSSRKLLMMRSNNAGSINRKGMLQIMEESVLVNSNPGTGNNSQNNSRPSSSVGRYRTTGISNNNNTGDGNGGPPPTPPPPGSSGTAAPINLPFPSNRKNNASSDAARPFRFVAPNVGEQMDSKGLRFVPEAKQAIIIRWRPAFDRSNRQKRWIALDRRMHPKLYAHASKEDNEQYGTDPLYKTNIPKSTLFRLAALPISPLQALAFVHSKGELRIQAILASFLHGQGEDEERLRDQESGARAAALAAVARGYVARTKLPTLRTHEERDWVSLDRILRPHLYLGEPPKVPVGSPMILRPGSIDEASRGETEFQRRMREREEKRKKIAEATAAAVAAKQQQQQQSTNGMVSTVVTNNGEENNNTSNPSSPSQEINARDGNIGLDTYDANLSAEGIRRTEGAFGQAVRKIFRKVFAFNSRMNEKSEQEAEAAEAKRERRKELQRLRKQKEEQRQQLRDGKNTVNDDRKSAGSMGSNLSGLGGTTNNNNRNIPPNSNVMGESTDTYVEEEEKRSTDDDDESSEEETIPRLPGAKGVQTEGGRLRPPGGTIGLGYSRTDLLHLLDIPAALVRSRKDRRAQLLLRAYGSDGGEWIYRTALSMVTPIVSGLAETAEAIESLALDLRKRKDVDYSSELAMVYPDGDDSNTAAVAALSANGIPLVRANHVLEVFSINDAPLRPGITVDHTFEIPGSLYDAVGYGPRASPIPLPVVDVSNTMNHPLPSSMDQPIIDPPSALLAPATSSAIGLGLQPAWLSTRSDADLAAIAQIEAEMKGIHPQMDTTTVPSTESKENETGKGKKPTIPLGTSRSGGNGATTMRSPSTQRNKATTNRSTTRRDNKNTSRSTGTVPQQQTFTRSPQSKKGPIDGSIADILQNAVPEKDRLRTQAELETGIVGATPVVVDMTITIAYHGSFVDRSYVLGKLNAGLYREAFVAMDDHPENPYAPNSVYGPPIYASPPSPPMMGNFYDGNNNPNNPYPNNDMYGFGGEGQLGNNPPPPLNGSNVPMMHISTFDGKVIHTAPLLRAPFYVGGDNQVRNSTADENMMMMMENASSVSPNHHHPVAAFGSRQIVRPNNNGGANKMNRIRPEDATSPAIQRALQSSTLSPSHVSLHSSSSSSSYLPSSSMALPRNPYEPIQPRDARPQSEGGLSVFSDTSRPNSTNTGARMQNNAHLYATNQSYTKQFPLRPVPPSMVEQSMIQAEDELGRRIVELPGWPQSVGNHVLDTLEGPRGIVPVRPASFVRKAFLHPNDLDPVALARLVNRKGDKSKNQKVPTNPLQLLTDTASNTNNDEPVIELNANGEFELPSLPSVPEEENDPNASDEGHASDPEVYTVRGDVLAAGRMYARHKRRTRIISEGTVKRIEGSLALRKPEGWFFNIKEAHLDLAMNATIGGGSSTLAGHVNTRIDTIRSRQIYLRPDGTAAESPNEPGARPADEVQDALFREESLGSDDIATATIRNAPSFGTKTVLEATGIPANVNVDLHNTIFPGWRKEKERLQNQYKQTHMDARAVSRGLAADKYEVTRSRPKNSNTSPRHHRPRSADAANKRNHSNRFLNMEATASSNKQSTTSTAIQTIEHDPAAGAEYQYDADGFLIVKKPRAEDDDENQNSNYNNHHPNSSRDPVFGNMFPSFPSTNFEPDRGTSIPIGVGISSGAGIGDDTNHRRKVRYLRRPLTYHPSQTPPLARTPPTDLLPSIPQDQVVSMMRHPVGYAVTSECTPNSIEGFGRIVIRHEPLHCPVLPGKYVVSITGLSPGSYSISVVCGLAYPAHVVTEGAIRAAAASRNLMESARQDIANMVASIRLGARKRQLVGYLIQTSDEKLQLLQGQMNRLRAGLEAGTMFRGELGSDDEGDFQTQAKKDELLAAAAEDVAANDDDSEKEDGEENTDEESESKDGKRIEDKEAGIFMELDEERKLQNDLKSLDPKTQAIAQARRKRQRIDVTETVRLIIQRRLEKLDKQFVTLVRSLHTRRREYNDINDGIDALMETKSRREGDLSMVMTQMKEYNRHMPALIEAMSIAVQDPVTGLLPLPLCYHPTKDKDTGKKGKIQSDNIFLDMGISNINDLLSLSGTVPTDSKRKDDEQTNTRQEALQRLQGKSTTPIESTSSGSSTTATDSNGKPEMSASSPSSSTAIVTNNGPDGLPSGPAEGTSLAIVRNLVGTRNRGIEYRYYYPCPDDEESLYVRYGPWALLWSQLAISSLIVDLAPTPAQTVRRKRIEDMNDEEKRWMSLDRTLNPDLYAAGSEKLRGITKVEDEDDEDLRNDAVNETAQALALTVKKEMGKKSNSTSSSPIKQGHSLALTTTGTVSNVGNGGGGGNSSSSSSTSDGNVLHQTVNLDNAVVRYDLEAPPKAILRAIYLSSEDKEGLRGNQRDIGKQTTDIMMKEGTQLMTEAAEAAEAIRHSLEMVTSNTEIGIEVTHTDEFLNENLKKKKKENLSLAHGLDVGQPAIEGGLGWSREPAALALRSISEEKASLFASQLDKALPVCEYSREELLRIISVPIQQLNTIERDIRKLLATYHDHAPMMVKNNALRNGNNRNGRSAFGTTGTGLGGGSAEDMIFDEKTGTFIHNISANSSPEALAAAAQAFTSMKRFQAVGAPFAVARSAVPIPIGAPAKLRRVLQERSHRLQAMWAKTLSNMQHAQAVNPFVTGGIVSSDVDERARDLLSEIDRANACNRPYMDSAVLHGQEQRFDISVLRDQLEMELDRVLLAQVYEREAIERALLVEAADAAAVDAAKEAAIEADKIRKQREAAILRMAQEEVIRREAAEAEAIAAGKKVLLTAEEAAERRARAAIRATMGTKVAAKADKVRAWKGDGFRAKDNDGDDDEDGKAIVVGKKRNSSTVAGTGEDTGFGGGDYDYDPNDPIRELGGITLWGDPDKPMTPRRAARLKARLLADRAKKKLELQSVRGAGTEAIAGRLGIITQKRKQDARIDRALAASMGRYGTNGSGGRGIVGKGIFTDDDGPLPPGMCRACRTIPCQWTYCIDIEPVKERKTEVERELFRVRHIPDAEQPRHVDRRLPTFVRSELTLSFLRGGPVKQTKSDVVFELSYELASLKSLLRLADVDKEIHGCYSTTDEAVTTVVLHGYPQQTWRSNAIVQLEAEINRIVAKQVATSLVDDALEYMLEGWYFGERNSSQIVAGYVPSLNRERPLRPFEATSAIAGIYSSQGPAARAKAQDAGKGLVPLHGNDPLGNLQAITGLAKYGLVTMSITGQTVNPPSSAMHNLTLNGSTVGSGNPYANTQNYISSVPPSVPGANSNPLSLVYSAFAPQTTTTGSIPPPMSFPSTTRSKVPDESEIMEINGPLAGYRSSGGGLNITNQPSQPSVLPPGFFRVENEEHAQRLRAQIQQQNALHAYLNVGNAALNQFQQATSTIRQYTQPPAVPSMSTSFSANNTINGVSGDYRPTMTALNQAIVPVNNNNNNLLTGPLPDNRPGASNKATGLQLSILKTNYASGMLALNPEALGSGVRTTQEQRTAGLAYAMEARAAIRQAIEAQAKVLHTMEMTETALRYGMFLLALMYFRIMNQLAKLKSSFGGDNEAASLLGTNNNNGDQPRNLGLLSSTSTAMTEERKRIINAEKAQLKRETAKAIANARAAAGFAAVAARQTAIETAERMAKVRKERKRRRQNTAALRIQCCYRGYRVRRTLDDYKRRKRAHDEFTALRTYAATRIQACWRGYVGRAVVNQRRQELLDFIKFYRSNEAEDMITEFYSQNPVRRYFRDRKTTKEKSQQSHVRATIGTARLLDDDDIRKRLGDAGAGIKHKFNNLAKGDRETKGKSEAELAFELQEEEEEERHRKALEEAKINAATNGKASTMNDDDDNDEGTVAKPLNLDKLGTDKSFFNIRNPGPDYVPVGKDRLKVLLGQRYASSTAKAFQVEASGKYETGIINIDDVLGRDGETIDGKVINNYNTTKDTANVRTNLKTVPSLPPGLMGTSALHKVQDAEKEAIQNFERKSAEIRMKIQRGEEEKEREKIRRIRIRAGLSPDITEDNEAGSVLSSLGSSEYTEEEQGTRSRQSSVLSSSKNNNFNVNRNVSSNRQGSVVSQTSGVTTTSNSNNTSTVPGQTRTSVTAVTSMDGNTTSTVPTKPSVRFGPTEHILPSTTIRGSIVSRSSSISSSATTQNLSSTGIMNNTPTNLNTLPNTTTTTTTTTTSATVPKSGKPPLPTRK